MTYDFSMSTDFGELEIYYANMAKMPEMDAATFAAQLGNAEKGKTGQVGAVETVTVGGQNYSKVSITRTNKKGKHNETFFHMDKQESFMVILATSCTMSDAGAMADVVHDHSSPVNRKNNKDAPGDSRGVFASWQASAADRDSAGRLPSYVCKIFHMG